MTPAPASPDNPEPLPPFEQSLEQVQRIIDAIEGGEVPLEESLSQYARGMTLIHHCRGILDRAEQKIKQLTTDSEGNLVERGEVEPRGNDL